MGALPKSKYSKARRGVRRGHIKLTPPVMINCPQCGSPTLPHHACPNCGTYKGRDAVEIKSSTSKTS